MVGLKGAMILAAVVVAVVVVIAALPYASYAAYDSKEAAVIATFEAFVGQEVGAKGVYSESFEYWEGYEATSYLSYWSEYWSGVFRFASVDIPYPIVSLILYEADPITHAEIGTFPGIDKSQRIPYEIGEQWSASYSLPVEKGDCIRWQIQIYLGPSMSVGYENGYYIVN
jgi:hypothetical protein